MNRIEQGQKTHADIIESARALFALHGYANTSTSDLLDTVSLSKGAFYHHFRSKEDLALAILEQARREYQQQLFDFVRERTEPDQQFQTLIQRVIELNTSGKWTNCLLILRLSNETTTTQSRLKTALAEILKWLISQWQTAAQTAQAAGKINKQSDAATIAQLTQAAIFGAILTAEQDEELCPLPKVLNTLLQNLTL